MSDDHFNYNQLMLESHRSLIRKVLLQVEETGLSGEHHFFIIFRTTHPGTRLSDRLRAQYPEEMTIVLQHQYSNLKIHKNRFEIQLSFNRIPELLVVPFASISGFVDPSVPFGLQLAGDPAAGLENSVGMLVPGLPQTSNEPQTPDEFMEGDAATSHERSENGKPGDDVEFWDGNETSVPSVFGSKSTLHNVNTDKNAADLDKIDENLEEDEEDPPAANIVQLDAFRKKSK
ncbi:MAG: hypothetical protein GY927_15405 [bacterium]|nr:hypothetical protein [bacterium]